MKAAIEIFFQTPEVGCLPESLLGWYMIKMKRGHFRSRKAKLSISVELLTVSNARYPEKRIKKKGKYTVILPTKYSYHLTICINASTGVFCHEQPNCLFLKINPVFPKQCNINWQTTVVYCWLQSCYQTNRGTHNTSFYQRALGS